MAFWDEEHQDRMKNIEIAWKNLYDLTELAKSDGINDIFQDNGAKVLQQLFMSNMQFLPGRQGNDAIDENGIEWEFKSINTQTTASGFVTDHHTTYELLDRFNSIPWLFSIYHGIQLQEMYVISPGKLDDWVKHQRENLDKREPDNKTLNNPKIPIKYVKNNGVKVYPIDGKMINPANYDRKVD
ncbi:hypothetical protein AWA2013_00680 [Lactiplantibacillus plantarum]|uniref:restriction endonuclease n=1 Tax=Lactiplantibacillus plantarum TaxID=1590 RepID=UPI0025739F12|nr:restriction endonuclease [Lactiplantibacillus plantarum]BEI48662.1 hypothetical protein AWA2013_00680 [Lactiplantibacillus plantarum]